MKKIFLSGFIISFFILPTFAAHITGGEMFYTYIQQLPNGNHQYKVTLKLYRNCGGVGAPLDLSAAIAVYLNNGNTPVLTRDVQLSFIDTLILSTPGPCINNPPTVCYNVGHYEFTIDLPASASGYTITYQRCCRAAGISNLINSDSFGATYFAVIPGNNILANAPVNNSAKFLGIDTVVVCANNSFSYNFGASDPDGDVLVYSFCSAFIGGGQIQNPPGNPNSPVPNPPLPPPYSLVPYSPPYSESKPLGSGVSINSTNGFITGVAPNAGVYVVTVCVGEYRNGVLIATQFKDLQVKVADCDVASADLDPEYITCDGFSLSFFNNTNSPLINSYFWDFGITSQTNDTSNLATPSFTFPDTGRFKITLITNRGQQCSDTATAIAKVYPGFFPGFTFNGVCINNPTQFTDTTKTAYGVVDSWRWDFGEPPVNNDTSVLQNPTYTYPSLGTKSVRFIVTNSKGCIDTVFKDVIVIDKPVISLAFRDTLICINDQLQLQAMGNGTFSWTPLTNILNANTSTPTVDPKSTTKYFVQLNDNGCINNDSVKVRVVSFVTLIARSDTTICENDIVQLGATTDGLKFLWTPSATLDDPTKLNANAIPAT
ncbi:MAG: PKD domain-containing protein, partial [Bacteroidota bacterium]|nr:PKD domain-containing protein [Bacteroidota bacterium]